MATRDNALKTRVSELMTAIGLRPEYMVRYPHVFISGQRQCIGIVRSLALNPKLIICDEPVSALDVSIQAQILNLLKDLQSDFGLAYLFVSHDLGVVQHISDRVAVMYVGRLVKVGPTRALRLAQTASALSPQGLGLDRRSAGSDVSPHRMPFSSPVSL